jgi:hypothetical protein
MSRGLKIGLAVGAGVLVLCCISVVVVYFVVIRAIQNSFTTDPAKVAEIGRQIVDYTPPRGYQERMAMTVLGMRLVALGPSLETKDKPILMLMQFPTSVQMDREEMERQMRQAWEQQGGQRNQDLHVVGTQEATIRGQSVTLTVSEGKAGDKEAVRQVVGAFSGKDARMVLFMATGTIESWDQGAVDEFLASIR